MVVVGKSGRAASLPRPLLPGKFSQSLCLGFNKRLSVVPCLPAASPAATTQVWKPNLWRPKQGLERAGWSPFGTEGAARHFFDSFSICKKQSNNRNQAQHLKGGSVSRVLPLHPQPLRGDPEPGVGSVSSGGPRVLVCAVSVRAQGSALTWVASLQCGRVFHHGSWVVVSIAYLPHWIDIAYNASSCFQFSQ